MPADLLLDRDSPLFQALSEAARERRCVFVAGLPGVGKSLLIQQLSSIAAETGRTVYLLQWDVARGAFETPEILARYPEVDGITHAAIRKAAGLWVRRAIRVWDQQHPDERALLIGELPLIGNRLIEVAQQQDDEVEPLLAGTRSLFLVPAPTVELRQAIERARAREMTDPLHERERANANMSVIGALWGELAQVAAQLGVSTRQPATGYDPDTYTGVYQQLLRHRQTRVLWIDQVLPVQASPHEHSAETGELIPSPDEALASLAEVERMPPGELERQIERWYQT